MVAATALMKYEKPVDSRGGVGGGSKPRMTCEEGGKVEVEEEA